MKKCLVILMMIFGASAAYGEIYTWKDARGTVFYTNSLNEIPARYLKKARVLDVATGKKGGLATAQPIVPAGSPGQTPGVQAPAGSPAAVPPPPIAAGRNPPLATPAPRAAPEAGIAAPQPQRRETREPRRTYRRRNRSANIEE
jgi:hypothetical protein